MTAREYVEQNDLSTTNSRRFVRVAKKMIELGLGDYESRDVYAGGNTTWQLGNKMVRFDGRGNQVPMRHGNQRA